MPSSSAPRRNFYGYDEKSDRLAQLQEVLGLKFKTVQFQVVESELRSLMEKNIDVKGHKCQYQHKALERIENEIQNKCPENFRGEDVSKKLYYARRAVMYMDHLRRFAGAAAFVDSDKQDRLKTERPNLKRSLTSLDSTIGPDRSDGRQAADEGLSKKRELDSTRERSPQKIARVSRSDSKQNATLRAKKEENTTGLNSSLLAESDFSFLQQFLSRCNPSMNHLCDKFIAFGCSTEAHFNSLSREWSEEKRHALLRRILFGTKILEDGRPLKEMDVEVIDYYLGVYFS